MPPPDDRMLLPQAPEKPAEATLTPPPITDIGVTMPPVIPPLTPVEPSGTPVMEAPAPNPVGPPPTASPQPEGVRWHMAPVPPVDAGTWMPAPGRVGARPGGWQPIVSAPHVARGQAPDSGPRADPVAELIQAVCQGRAVGVEVRRTGVRSLNVCFETRTDAEAARLVKDISARRELAPYAIEFCVLVK